MEVINARINNEFCQSTVDALNDKALIEDYKNCKSVKNRIIKLEEVLHNNNIENNVAEKIIKDYLLELIPAGTKGAIRGNKFNTIVRKIIEGLNLSSEKFEIGFESHPKINPSTDEIPDWYVLEKLTGKIIIGMNQLDFFSGGHQLNRGYKYLVDNKHNTKNSKLLCVVCNKINFKSNRTKSYKLFSIGFENNTLCYVKNINNIIMEYFKSASLKHD